MKDVPLSDFLGAKSSHAKQKALAAALGITQSAISQMASSDRQVFVRVADDQVVGAYEIKAVPSGRHHPLPPPYLITSCSNDSCPAPEGAGA